MKRKATQRDIVDKVDKMQEVNARFRGEIINSAINVETRMEMIISLYFTSGNKVKAQELRHCLLSHAFFSANNKKNLFLFILNKEFSNVKIKSKDLERVMNIRNQMAHGKMIYDAGNLVGPILAYDGQSTRIQEWKTKRNKVEFVTLEYNEKKIQEELAHMLSIGEKLRLIYDDLKKKK